MQYDKENVLVRTTRINSLFSKIALLARVPKETKKATFCRIDFLVVMSGLITPVLTKSGRTSCFFWRNKKTDLLGLLELVFYKINKWLFLTDAKLTINSFIKTRI
jgi:hypothetical protein